MERPEVKEALFLGSPDLYDGLPAWQAQPTSDKGKKIERSLFRYFSRMTSRPTPFGLFAGCSVGRIGAGTRLEIAGRAKYQRRSRLDMEYLYALAEWVVRTPALRSGLAFRPNTSLYQAGGKYHYAEGRFDGKKRSYHLVALDKTPYLEQTLERSVEYATADTLAKGLVEDDPAVLLSEAKTYVSELIDGQVLIACLSPLVTGVEPTGEIIERLNALPGAEAMASRLDSIDKTLKAIDSAGVGVPARSYQQISEHLEALPIEPKRNHLFQVDLIKPAPHAVLGERVVREVLKGVEALYRMIPPESEDALSRFKVAFSERYQDREVLLVEALDEETGVLSEHPDVPNPGASPLLAGIHFPGKQSELRVSWTRRESFLLGKVERAREGGELEIRLDEGDLQVLSFDGQKPFPDAFSALVSIAASSSEEVERGNFKVYLSGASGPSGVRLLGRFCHADTALQEAVSHHLRAEEALRPEALFAEIVHLPEGRIGNILLRPCLREFEIPFLGRSGAPVEKQIPITDLMISLRGGRVALRSKRLGKEVVPRLSSAHNYGTAANLKLYRFLCLLQIQDYAGGVSWDWGVLGHGAFLPRVSYGRLVLSRAQWRVDRQAIESLAKAQGTERLGAFQVWCERNKMPRFVSLADGDNELLVDRGVPLAVETLVEYVKNRAEVRLVEMFPGPDELCCEGPEGRFVHEVVIPFVRTNQGEDTAVRVSRPAEAVASKETRQSGPGEPLETEDGQNNKSEKTETNTATYHRRTTIKRAFLPGSEWLFAKFYTSPALADRLLTDFVRPTIREVKETGAAKGWFFVRYGDPEWHLRVRFAGDPPRLVGEVLPLLREIGEQATARGLLRGMQLDTYDREIERYGGNDGMILTEGLFHHDSDAVLALLSILSGDEGAEARWKLVLVGIDRMLADLGFDLPAKQRLLTDLRDTFTSEFKADGPFKKSVSDRFRRERSLLDSLLDPSAALQTDLAPGVMILEQRSEAWRGPINDLVRQIAAGQLSASMAQLAGSFVHMHVNRMLRSGHRAQEAVLYHFLAQLYESRLARTKNAASKSSALGAP